MAKSNNTRGPRMPEPRAITEIQVAGFKSISKEQRIEIRPLTILAGPNSSGKSSIMQPVLLLKQTSESPYDPGPLLLHGPNVKFTSADELLSQTGKRQSSSFRVGMRLKTGERFQTTFRKERPFGFRIEQMEISDSPGTATLWPGMTHAEIVETGITRAKDYAAEVPPGHGPGRWEITEERSFLEPAWLAKGPAGDYVVSENLTARWDIIIPEVIHLPGLRGNPERSYPVTAVGPNYPGTFEKYTASVISQWMAENDEALATLNGDLRLLQLTGGVIAVRPNDVQVELYVGRLPESAPTRPEDRINIADVGIGVSQTLPVLVALHAAKPGQLVYVEQPETHLHPRAQFALAQVLASAANRGVRVVAETHSAHLLLGVQTLVAEGELAPGKVKLHWFQRPNGRTVVNSADLDEAGAFGDWPEDFDEVELQTDNRYINAAHARLAERKHG
jgi:hypothetical protein